jgi:hypothetical protein
LRRISFRLTARVNDAEFEMNGSGIGDQTAGTCELHLTAVPRFPDGFDPVSCPKVCSHPTSLFFAATPPGVTGFGTLTGNDYAISPARDGQLYNAASELVMRLRVTGHVYLDGDTLVSEHSMEGFSHLPRIARTVTPFEDYLLPGPAGTATALSRYTLLTRAGEKLDGITTVPYRWANGLALAAPLARNVANIHVDWDGGAAVHAYYETALRRIEPADATHLAATRG